MTTYVIDTHALVWFLENNPRLSDNAKAALLSKDANIVLPTIVLVEVAFLYAKKKISLDLPTVISQVAGSSNCTVYPLDEEVVLRVPTDLNIHDAMIVATGLVFRDVMGHDVALITKDEEITKSNLIRTIW